MYIKKDSYVARTLNLDPRTANISSVVVQRANMLHMTVESRKLLDRERVT